MPGEYQRSLGESLILERREVPEAYGAIFTCRGEPTTRRRKGEGQNGIVMSTRIRSGCENLSLVVTSLSAVPCCHGHTSGIIIRPLGADPPRSAGLYSSA